MTPPRGKQGQLDRLEEKVDRIVAALFGSEDVPDRPGYVERMRQVEGYVGLQKRIVWLAAGSAIASLAVMSFDVLTR